MHVALVQNPCTSGDPTQQWALVNGNMLVALSDVSQCLDLRGGAASSGGVLVTSLCYGSPTQQWAFERASVMSNVEPGANGGAVIRGHQFLDC